MGQPEFIAPDFIDDNSREDIHERMMANLPEDIDDMEGGFVYDFTMPAAIEKEEFINYTLVRVLMLMFPQYAWGEWLDNHAQQLGLTRNPAVSASGYVEVEGVEGTVIAEGTVFCTEATDTEPSIEFQSKEEVVIDDTGKASIEVEAVETGVGSNVSANTVTLMSKPSSSITRVNNPEAISGGTDTEEDDALWDRMALEYDNSNTYLGNDVDYKRWAKAAGAGDAVVDPAAKGPGTVQLVLIDPNGQPANQELLDRVYNYIVSPDDRTKRLLPTACAKLYCVAAETVLIDFTCTGLVFDETTSLEQIGKDFKEAVKKVYSTTKEKDGILRYNDVRPIMKSITGVIDFDTFLMNGGMANIVLSSREYPDTGTVEFT